jgi:membrane complex biogenesis BtpA family protein
VIERVPLSELFPVAQPIVAMVHLDPLPGAPRFGGSFSAVLAKARDEARALAEAGADGLLVENFGDAPFYPGPVPPETIAALAIAVREVANTALLPIGVNVLRNDAAAALGIAAVCGAAFVRVNVHVGAMLTDQGWIEGRAHETLRTRARLDVRIALLCDVLVKHALAPAGLEIGTAARDTWDRGLADALIVSGEATGSAPAAGRLQAVRDVVPHAPLWIGSGLTPENAADLLPLADGAIVGSTLRQGGVAGRPLDPERVDAWFRAARPVSRH